MTLCDFTESVMSSDALCSQEQQSLWQIMASLCDLLFAGYADQIESLE